MADSVVTAALQRIADRNGGILEPSAVVKSARNPSSPIHDRFTWDDSAAAEKCRLAEARALIRSITLTVTDRSITWKVPKYIRNPEAASTEQGYVAIVKLRDENDLAREVCVREFGRAKEALARAQGVAAYLGLEGQVAEGLAVIEELTRRASEQRPPGAA